METIQQSENRAKLAQLRGGHLLFQVRFEHLKISLDITLHICTSLRENCTAEVVTHLQRMVAVCSRPDGEHLLCVAVNMEQTTIHIAFVQKNSLFSCHG